MTSMKKGAGILILLLVFIVSSSSFIHPSKNKNLPAGLGNEHFDKVPDSVISKKSFLAAYKVLMSPRCMNCHPSGDAPLQGDDSRIHTQGVLRGKDGKGLYALKCSNCHQPANTPGPDMPPGNPKWQLPPSNMKMVFQGKTPRQLAAQLLDPTQNGGKNKEQLIDHVTNDTLVASGWHPGEGRTLPPLTHKEFAMQFKQWLDKGAYLPD
jgi:mono/diheme cytochrome c family protein